MAALLTCAVLTTDAAMPTAAAAPGVETIGARGLR
jgi:hypothetical protein